MEDRVGERGERFLAMEDGKDRAFTTYVFGGLRRRKQRSQFMVPIHLRFSTVVCTVVRASTKLAVYNF